MKHIFRFGMLLVNIIVRSKLSGVFRDDFIDIISTLKEMGIDEFEARTINREFEKIGDGVAHSCKKILENVELSEYRKDIIIENMIKAYENADLTIAKLLNLQVDVGAVKKILLQSNSEYKDVLDEKEIEICERLLEHTANIIVGAYMKIPEFTQEGIKRLNAKIEDITSMLEEIISQVEKIDLIVGDKSKEISNFERIYRNNIINQNNYVYLFGAGDLSRKYKRYPLSVAYVELELVDSRLDTKFVLNKILRASNNIWISGNAGYGKTTLLQWFAVKSAENDSDIYGIRDTIPLLIQLRKYDCKNLSLQECIRNVMKDSSYDIPQGWIENLLDTGRFLFLIDGFDEIDRSDVDKVLEWLEEVDGKGKCRKIFTSRPQVKCRPKIKNLLEVEILPMKRPKIKKFIEYWHRAVLEEQLEEGHERANIYSKKLYEKICMSEALFKLTTIPLLCAMICTLHYRNELRLPANRRELYEECCKMLIENRDGERNIKHQKVKLSYEEKKIILAKLAYWMMKNRYVEIDIEVAKNAIKRFIGGMSITQRVGIEEDIFNYLLERCGILKEIEMGKIAFLHRTFQEYLTAFEVSRQEDWGVIKEKIGNNTWQETIGICIGYANSSTASEIIEETIEKGRALGKEKKFFFLAIEYISGAVEIKAEVRRNIEEQLSRLLPPHLEEAQELANAGDLVVKYLDYKPEYTNDEKIACLRVLRMVGTINALEISKTYLREDVTNMEIRELGELYCQFENKELLELGIPLELKRYINKACDLTVILHEEMFRVLNLLEKKEREDIYNLSINNMEIIFYQNNLYLDQKVQFKIQNSVTICGSFCNLEVLNHVSDVKKLSVYSENPEFEIYNLNEYQRIYGIEEFCLITNSSEYINGKDLEFCKNCKSVEFVFLNDQTEVFFDYFDLLKNLNKVTVGARFVLDIDYDTVPRNVKYLKLLVPTEEKEYINSRNTIQTRVENVVIRDLEEYLKNDRKLQCKMYEN